MTTASFRKDADEALGTAILAAIGGVAFLPLVLLYSGALYGWALSTMWGWFVVPTFHLPPLSFALAYALDLTVGLVKGPPFDADELTCKKERGTWESLGYHLFRNTTFVLLIMACGYALHRWFV